MISLSVPSMFDKEVYVNKIMKQSKINDVEVLEFKSRDFNFDIRNEINKVVENRRGNCLDIKTQVFDDRLLVFLSFYNPFKDDNKDE